MTTSIAEATLQGAQVLRQAGVSEARREAASLLAHVTGKDRTFQISHPEHLLTADEVEEFRELVEHRARGKPLQYITGCQDFYGRVFRVTTDVLIPRPETETLVEAALELISTSAPRWLICDVGTGSGCIAITLLSERKNVCAIALDISPRAIEVARENATAYSVNNRISFVVSDCFDSLLPGSTSFDLIVSNPPYVSEDALPGLQREVRDHEPLVALSPGRDGLAMVRRLLRDAPRFSNLMGTWSLRSGLTRARR